MNFGIYLKAARERAGLSQKELADRLNVPQQSIGRYEKSDIDPRISFVISVASVLGIGLDELMNYKPNKQQYYFDLLDKCGYTISNNPSLDYYTITSKFCEKERFNVYKQYFCNVMDTVIFSINDDVHEYFLAALHAEINFKYIVNPAFLNDLEGKLVEGIVNLQDTMCTVNPNMEYEKLLECLQNCRQGIIDYIATTTENNQNKIYPQRISTETTSQKEE